MTALASVVDDSPQSWNDRRGQTHDDVVAALAAAAKLVQTRTGLRD